MSTDPSIEISSNDVAKKDTNPKPKKQKKLTSDVWLDFDRICKKEEVTIDGKLFERDTTYAKCKRCTKELRHGSGMGTTHLSNHSKCYPNRIKIEHGQQQILSMLKSDGSSVITNYTFDDEKSRMLLDKAIIVHEYPFNMVCHSAFRAYVLSLRPQHKIPSRITMAKMCKIVFDDEKKKLYHVFKNLSSRISLTMDKWTASTQNKSYLCIIAHFIDDSWSLQKRIINFFNVNGSTGSDISNYFLSRMFEWNIDQKLFTVTVDNDKANDVALRLVKTRLGDSLISNGLFFHVRCAAHIINLVVQDGLKMISKSIEKVRLSIKYVTCSPQMEANFLETAKQVDFCPKKSLSLDCCTRWNSTYLMLSTALEYKDVFKRFGFRDVSYIHGLSDDEWGYIKILEECLKHFYDATELLSGSNYVTSNLFFVEFCEIQLLFIEWLKSNDSIIVSMATVMKKKFDKYWDMCNQLLAIASILDPRYKMKAVVLYYKDIYQSDGMRKVEELCDIITNIFHTYASAGTPTNMSHAISTPSLPPEKKKSRFAQLMDDEDAQPLKTELDEYLEEKCLRWKETSEQKFDILGWWKQNVGRFSILGKIAKDILGIPVSTVASESAFSTGGRVVDAYRSRLNPDMVEALICSQDWLKDEFKDVVDDTFTDMNDIVEIPSRIEASPSIPTNDKDKVEGYETDFKDDEFGC